MFDILGNEIVTLVEKNQPEGNYEVTFRSDQLAAGVYFYTLEISGHKQTKKMLLLK